VSRAEALDLPRSVWGEITDPLRPAVMGCYCGHGVAFRAGSRCRREPDSFGPQEAVRRGRGLRSDADSNREAFPPFPDNRPLRPATTGSLGFEPRLPGLEPGVLPVTPRPYGYARLDSNQRPLPSQDSALSAELRACEEPPAGVEPAPRPYKGRVLAVDTTEARGGDGRT
jgi:hypothetical protein